MDDQIESQTESDPAQASVDLELDANVEEVWAALTTAEGLAPWFGEGSTLEAEPGGALRFPDPVTGRPRRGVVEQVDAERELSFTWWLEDDPTLVTDVTITVQPVGPNTLIRVAESVRPAAVPGEVMAWSWRSAVLSVSAQPAHQLALSA